ncbi:hypothetical protein [Streptomyces zhihengii]|nr:hypothetical protein [Streptomyces zhihengii]
MMEIDWGNPGFLRLYGLVFALSAAFTAVMWLISVVKRAVRGIPVGQAIMENVGYLLMSVVVASFSPLVVALTVDFVDSAAEEILGDYVAEVFVGGAAVFTALAALSVLMPVAGVVIAIPIALAILVAVFGLWIMLVVRNALILMGLIFGPIVFSGLVDKDLWGHTKKYIGILGGIIASKLGIYLALALAGALLDGIADSTDRMTIPQAIGTSLTFLALLFIALFMPFQIAKWIPFVGDELQSMHQTRQEAGQRGRAAQAKGKQKQNDMAQQAAQKQGASMAGSAATGPATAAVALQQAADDVRDQTKQAAMDGANNAAGDGGQSSGGSPPLEDGQSNSPKQGSGSGQKSRRGTSSRSGGPVGGTGRRQGREAAPFGPARPFAPPPPRAGGGRPPAPPPPSPEGGQTPPTPPSPAPPPPPPSA